MDKLAVGVAAYGTQHPKWWIKFGLMTGTLHKNDIDLVAILGANSMSVDGNRNNVAKSFLKTDADWLLWVDTDNTIPLGGVRRLLDTGKDIVTGLYYMKEAPYNPVAMTRNEEGQYNPIRNWRRGEILPIDIAGFGCTLIHRRVYETMQAELVPVQMWSGAHTCVHKSDIVGELGTERGAEPKVVNGVWQQPVHIPSKAPDPFIWHLLEYGRTEDIWFFEMAAKCGFLPWCDTSVEVPHIWTKDVTGDDYRDHLKETKLASEKGEVTYLWEAIP